MVTLLGRKRGRDREKLRQRDPARAHLRQQQTKRQGNARSRREVVKEKGKPRAPVPVVSRLTKGKEGKSPVGRGWLGHGNFAPRGWRPKEGKALGREILYAEREREFGAVSVHFVSSPRVVHRRENVAASRQALPALQSKESGGSELRAVQISSGRGIKGGRQVHSSYLGMFAPLGFIGLIWVLATIVRTGIGCEDLSFVFTAADLGFYRGVLGIGLWLILGFDAEIVHTGFLRNMALYT
ncbi:hypothetical protein ZIOFF_035563 [Zingiber officinale]|uniref:Uncharacterized protein n=1 Tax=Zingiber officinale TaxID=94328 RepID=A0A8J5GMV0_ZINOF|nr:hypothetical protein ZIOFF_035563 [Zingiber officinale]